MAVFEYRAVEANGVVTEGRIDAGGRQDAARIIEQRGLTPVRLTESVVAAPAATARPVATSWSWKSTRVSFSGP